MKRRQLTSLALAAILSVTTIAATHEEATPSGEAWLGLIDGGKYGESWSESSALFRTQVAAQKWIEMIAAGRGPLGVIKSRKLKSIQFMTAVPGAPDGNYALILFDSSFEHKANSIETLTLMEDAGKWRAAGYFIK